MSAQVTTQLVDTATNDFEISFPAPITPNDLQSYLQMPAADQARFNDALKIVKAVWASDEFKQRVLNEHFQPYRNDDIHNNVVFKRITTPHPKLMSLYVCAFDAGALASTLPATHQTCVFKNYLYGKNADLYALVNTISHEYTHTTQAGTYRHSTLSTWYSEMIGVGRNRDETVPYAVGNIAEEIAKAKFPDPTKLP